MNLEDYLLNQEYEELIKSETEIKESLKNFTYFEGNYKFYGLLDHIWYQNYKKYLIDALNGKNKKQFFFLRDEAAVKTEKKLFCFIEKNFSFNFITNFELVTSEFIHLLLKNNREIKPKLNEFLFYIIIGGESMIRQDSHNGRNIYISYYKENQTNKIDFWLCFEEEDEEQKKLHLNLILTYNLWHYLELINFNYNDGKKDIYNEKGKKIGFLVNNCEEKRSIYLDSLKKEKLKNSSFQQITKIINIELIPKTISVLACLSLFKEFQNELILYSKDNRYKIAKSLIDFYMKFPNANHDNETTAISGLLSINANMKKTLIEIANFINDEFFEINSIKEKEPKIIDSDENLAKNKFFELKKKGSIIQRLFYSIMKTKIYCCECSLTSYNFEYSTFLEIDLSQEHNPILLNNIIFKTKKCGGKKVQCSFCSKKTESNLEQFIIDYSNILIVAFTETHLKHFDKFNTLNNLVLSNGKNISYNLVCFIEVMTNVVYFKGMNNIWNKYLGNNIFKTVESIEKLKPIILFYRLNNNQQNKLNVANNQNQMNNNQFAMNNMINMNNNLQNQNQINPNTKFNMKNMAINTNMNNMGMNNVGMNNMRMNNNMGINNMGMNNMGLNNMRMNNNMGMNNAQMNNVGMGINNAQMNNVGMNNNINNMRMNNANNLGINNANNMGMNYLNNMGMNNMNNAGMNNMNNIGMNKMNNMGMNNMNNEGMNNMNNNIFQANNNNGNIENKAPDENKKTIFLKFTFEEYNKQIFIDVDENEKFKNLIIELEEKYRWLRTIKNRTYFYLNKQINENLSIKELNIVDNSNIIIKI